MSQKTYKASVHADWVLQGHVCNFVQSLSTLATHNFLLGISFTIVCGALEGSSIVLPKHFFVRASFPGFCNATAVNKPETRTFCPVSNCSCNTFRIVSRMAFVSLSVQFACSATHAMKFAMLGPQWVHIRSHMTDVEQATHRTKAASHRP